MSYFYDYQMLKVLMEEYPISLLEEAVKAAQEQRSAAGLTEVLAACGPQHQALQTRIQTLLSDPSIKM